MVLARTASCKNKNKQKGMINVSFQMERIMIHCHSSWLYATGIIYKTEIGVELIA